jgi:ketosteroid isomerase-like protein
MIMESMRKNKKFLFTLGVTLLLLGCGTLIASDLAEGSYDKKVRNMVEDHARAWETGDETLLSKLLHDDVVFAYPGRRLNKEETLEDLRYFRDHYEDTKVYIHNIIVEGDMVAVEWQFATTKKETGAREVVSDAIIGELKDGRFIVWKEYLDGRVKGFQAEGKLYLEEGEEPFPWPLKTDTY